MSWIDATRARLRLLFARRAAESRMDEEFRFHIQMETEKNIRAGMSREEARRRAAVAFGGAEEHKQEMRDGRGLAFMEHLRADIRYGSRLLRRSPGFSAVAVLSIAIGVGATTAVFGLVDAVLFHSLPYAPFDRLVMIWHQSPSTGQDRITMSPGDYFDYATQTRSFTSAGAARGLSLTARFGDESVAIGGVEVTPSLFSTLGIRPALGRGFRPADDNDASRVAVVTHEFWQRRLAADAGALGRELVLRTGFDSPPGLASIDGSYTIVGVLPPDARLPYLAADVWIPLSRIEEGAARDNGGLIVFAQLKAGVSIDQASADVAAITRRIAERFPDRMRGQSSWLITLRAEDVGDITPTLVLVVVSVALLSLIVCTNLGNMLLSRLTERQREIAVRRALGAGDRRIVGQLFVEASLLAGAGAVAGIVLASWLTSVLATTGPATVSRIAEVQVDGRALLVAIATAVVMSIILGLLPATRVSRASVGSLSLRSGNAAPGGRLRELLIGVEVAMAFVVLVGAGLVITSATSLGNAAIGYDPRHVLTFQVALPRDAYSGGPIRSTFTTALLERLRALPGATAAGGVSILPQIDANSSVPFAIDDRVPSSAAGGVLSARFRTATPGYFASMGIPLIGGRDFVTGDQRSRAVVISQSFRDRYFPTSDPTGYRLRLQIPGLDTMSLPIVGVVGDVRQWIEATPDPTIYLMSVGQPMFSVAVRTTGDPALLAASVQRAVREIDPNQPIFDVTTMEARLRRGQGLSFARFRTLLMSGLGFVSLVLAALGIYGVVRYAVVSRTKEFGIRMALGASRVTIVGMVLSRSLRAVSAGLAVGVVASIGGAKVAASTLYGAVGAEPFVIVAVTALLASLAIAAAVEPAWRAGGVDPLVALRPD